MLRCISLAKKGMGKVSPNPLVGAILVKNNKIIGTGYHTKYGAPHAEVEAIKKAGKKTKGAALYINLEPCCHYGQTPPCTKAIIKAGISEVHFAILDPNSLVRGKGKMELEKAGIKVFVGEEQEQANILNEVFLKQITTGLPYVAAKWAMSLDGKIATHTGDSKWITNEKSRSFGRKLRYVYDAILVGVNTIIKDNPRLTARDGFNRSYSATTIVLDSMGRLPLNSQIFKEKNKIIIATTKKMPVQKEKAYLAKGAQVLRTTSLQGKVNLKEVMKKIVRQKINSVLIEGGGEVLASAIQNSLVDKAYIFIGNKIIGGKNAKTPVGGQGYAQIKETKNWHLHQVKKIVDDLFIIVYP